MKPQHVHSIHRCQHYIVNTPLTGILYHVCTNIYILLTLTIIIAYVLVDMAAHVISVLPMSVASCCAALSDSDDIWNTLVTYVSMVPRDIAPNQSSDG